VGSIGTESWTIVLKDGTKDVVKVDAETKIAGSSKVGDEVDVLFRPLPDGSALALLIAASVPLPTIPTERYEGVVKAIGPTSWTVGPKAGDRPDRLFAVSEKTTILGNPRVGDQVGILAERQSDGSFLAIVITKTTSISDAATQVVFEGVLNRSAADGSMGFGTWLVGDTRVLVSRLTAVLGEPKVGDRVRVEGFRVRDGSVMASRITKL
jgi:hypothetical protein